MPVNRGIFDAQIAGLLRRTEEILEDVLQEAQLTWAHIDKVLLVGGSTRMPAVRQMLEKVTGKTPELGLTLMKLWLLVLLYRRLWSLSLRKKPLGLSVGVQQLKGCWVVRYG